jgi:Dimethlysulfonioproprionate lyase
MSKLARTVGRLARLLIGLIADAKEIGGGVELARFTSNLRLLSDRPDIRAHPRAGEDIAVCSYLDEALHSTTDASSHALAREVAQLAPFLAWTQNPNYRRTSPSEGFLRNYGYGVIAGPERGAPALARHPDLALGILLLGPHTEYPAHRHPAEEIYIPLGVAEWRIAAGPWALRTPGTVIHHPPNIVHATRTVDRPLAALYLWTGDLATHARLDLAEAKWPPFRSFPDP